MKRKFSTSLPRLQRGVLLVLTSAICLSLAAPAWTEILERIIVKVNGEIFTKSQLERRQVEALRQENVQGLSDEELKKRVDQIMPQLLVDAVDTMLILQRGRELGYTLSDEQFQQILDQVKTENKITSDEQFQQALEQEHLTMADLRRQIEDTSIIRRVEDNEVFSHITVTDEEARKYYEEHQAEFTSVPTVTVREIFVRVPQDDPSTNEQAAQKAASIRERALKGEDFGKLATELSDAPSKANGGLVGPINRSELLAAIAKALETMKVGDISPVVRTSTGYEFVKLESSTEQKVLPFDQAHQQISNKVYAGKQRVEFDKYMQKLRASAIIDWKVPELKKLYDAQIARGAQGESIPR